MPVRRGYGIQALILDFAHECAHYLIIDLVGEGRERESSYCFWVYTIRCTEVDWPSRARMLTWSQKRLGDAI
jgi:hypothetical protein